MVHARIPAETKSRFLEIAKAKGTSPSALINEWIENFINEPEYFDAEAIARRFEAIEDKILLLEARISRSEGKKVLT